MLWDNDYNNTSVHFRISLSAHSMCVRGWIDNNTVKIIVGIAGYVLASWKAISFACQLVVFTAKISSSEQDNGIISVSALTFAFWIYFSSVFKAVSRYMRYSAKEKILFFLISHLTCKFLLKKR